MNRKLLRWLIPVGITGLLVIYVVICLMRPLPTLQPTKVLQSSTNSVKVTAPDVAWSQYGEQAVGAVGYGQLTSNGKNQPLPTASVAKVMAALAVLQKKPLAVGDQGPTITLTAADVALYNNDNTNNQSVVAVQAGEQITEYQALEAMLVPSATNLATSLTSWAFGSQSAYLDFANSYAKTLGMTQSIFADASGYSPQTTSTPSDLIQLGTAAAQQPVVAQIVNQRSVDLPVVGTVANFNIDVGIDGINGIKTGNTDEAGGALLYSAAYNGLTIIGVTMGAPDLGTALHDAPEILDSFKASVQTDTIVQAGQTAALYSVPWGGKVTATAQRDVNVVDFIGTKIPLTVTTQAIIKENYRPKSVGSISFAYQGKTYTTPLVLHSEIPKPGIIWRLLHP